jgi:hypothetical protein
VADLAEELEVLGGGGALGTALKAARFWPAAASGLMVPGTLTGDPVAAVVLAGGLAAVVLTSKADKRLQARP